MTKTFFLFFLMGFWASASASNFSVGQIISCETGRHIAGEYIRVVGTVSGIGRNDKLSVKSSLECYADGYFEPCTDSSWEGIFDPSLCVGALPEFMGVKRDTLVRKNYGSTEPQGRVIYVFDSVIAEKPLLLVREFRKDPGSRSRVVLNHLFFKFE
jgi:hypothetical protein